MEKEELRKTDQVLSSAKGTTLDSKLVAELLGINRDQASHILNSLCGHGHLKKHSVNIEEIGGRYYNYNITKSGENRLDWLEKNGRL